MNCLRLIILVLLLVLLPLHTYAAVQGVARLVLIEGEVQVRVADTDDWLPAARNMPLYEGDSIWTPVESSTELQLLDGTVIRLDSRSSLSVLKVEEDALQFHLGMGRIYVRTGDMKQWSIQFDCEDSTVKIIDKARLRLDITETGEEEISVFRGSAYVESYGNRTKVRKGEMLSVEDARAEISPVNPPDSWDRWNSDRDSRSAQRTVYNDRLPEELAIYDEELSSSGEWLEIKEYGRVWRPTAVVTTDWAPYRSGRWIWRGGDYVWIATEPWGWAPYHYGRWAVVAGFGWCWVPPLRGDVFWSPGFVGWVTTPAFVGWVPLAPGEIYYGRGHYGRHSVNVTNVTNITVVNTTHVYRNSGHRHAITGVDRNAFITGRGRYAAHSADVFSKGKITGGRPEPKPHSKEILVPQVRTIPVAQLPPPAVTRLPVRDLKERFPRIDRGGTFVPQRDRNRPATGETAPRDRQGKPQSAADRSTLQKRPESGTPALVKPVVPQSPEPKRPSPLEPERKTPVQHHRDQPVVDTTSKRQAVESTRRDSLLPVPKQSAPPRVRPVETQADRKGQGAEHREQGVDRHVPANRVSEKTPERKDVGRKAAAPPERRATNIWKIKPREESQPAKEKK